MVVYSYSRLNTFDQCPLKYKFTYIDRAEKDFENSIESFMGSCVHETLEQLYKDLKYQKVMSLDDLIKLYTKIWKSGFNDNLKVVKGEYSAKDYQNMGKKYLTDYYNSHKPFDEGATIGLELEVNLDLFQDGNYKLMGYIDRLSIKNSVYIIHDYKTSNTLPTNEQIENDKQLRLYSLALKQIYPDANNIELIWHYLAFDKDIIVKLENFDYAELKEEIKNKISHIESLDSSLFVPKESILCEWCVFASNCPKRKHIVKTKQLGLEEFGKDYGVNLATKYFTLIDKKTELDIEINDLQDKIFEYANREKIDNIYSGSGTLKLYQEGSFKLPVKGTLKFEQLRRILKENNLEQYLTIDSYNLVKSLSISLLPVEVIKQILPLVEEKEVKRIYPKKFSNN